MKWLKWPAYWLLRLFDLSYRYRFLNPERQDQALKMGKGVIYALWHENIVGPTFALKNRSITPIISRSKDGDLASFIVEKFGYYTVRGSSHKGGKLAKLDLDKVVQANQAVALTVDGPKGPRHNVKKGAVQISYDNQSPIVPITAALSLRWVFKKSWDHFKLPLPFSKVYIYFGEPMVMKSVDETACDTLKQKLLEADKKAYDSFK